MLKFWQNVELLNRHPCLPCLVILLCGHVQSHVPNLSKYLTQTQCSIAGVYGSLLHPIYGLQSCPRQSGGGKKTNLTKKNLRLCIISKQCTVLIDVNTRWYIYALDRCYCTEHKFWFMSNVEQTADTHILRFCGHVQTSRNPESKPHHSPPTQTRAPFKMCMEVFSSHKPNAEMPQAEWSLRTLRCR